MEIVYNLLLYLHIFYYIYLLYFLYICNTHTHTHIGTINLAFVSLCKDSVLF